MSLPEPEPISPDRLPPVEPPQYEYLTVLGAPSGCLLWPGEQPGRVVVKRLVTYGEWEPATPNRWKDPEPDSDEDRLAAIKTLAQRVMHESTDHRVWGVAQIIDQLAMGTITIAQGRKQLKDYDDEA